MLGGVLTREECLFPSRALRECALSVDLGREFCDLIGRGLRASFDALGQGGVRGGRFSIWAIESVDVVSAVFEISSFGECRLRIAHCA